MVSVTCRGCGWRDLYDRGSTAACRRCRRPVKAPWSADGEVRDAALVVAVVLASALAFAVAVYCLLDVIN